jgi:glycosyltransferase involved in cell wall biosynthesis
MFPGNPLEIAVSGNKYRGLMKSLALLGGKVHMHLLRAIAKRSSVALMLSGQLYEHLSCSNDNSAIFYTSLVDKQNIRSGVDPIGSPLKLLYAGRLSHEKGIGDLVEAIRLLLDSGNVIELTICGDGPEKGKLESLCRALKLEKQIAFLGFIPPGDGLVEVFRRHDIFVHPSYSEGFPKVIWEAMAQGLPVITTPVGSVSEVIDDGKNGLFVQCRQPQEIHDAVLRIIEDEGLRMRLIVNGYHLARHNTIQAKADQLIRYFSLRAASGNPQ